MKKVLNKIEKIAMPVFEKIHLKIFGHEMSNTMRGFLGSLFTVSIGMMSSSVLLFIVYVFGARFLGPVEYGKFQLIVAISNFITIFMLFGINTATTQYLSSEKKYYRQKLIQSSSTVLFIISVVTTISVSIIFEKEFVKILHVEKYFFEIALFLSLTVSCYYFFRAILQGTNKINTLSLLEFLNSAGVSLIFSIVFFSGLNNYMGLLFTFFGGYGIFIVGSIFKTISNISIVRIRTKVLKKLLGYSSLAFLGGFSGVLSSSIDKVMLNNFSGLGSVGTYSIYILSSSMIFAQLLNIFVTVFFPQASAFGQKKYIAVKLNKISPSVFLGSFIVSIITIIGVLLLSGKNYDLNILYILLFSLSTSIMSCYQLKMWLLNSEGTSGVRITIQGLLFASILNFLINLILIPIFSIYGAIIATIVSNLVLYRYFTNKINKIFV